MYIGLHVKYRYCCQIFENLQIQDFMKIRSVGAELFHADGRTDRQTDMTNLILAFRNFAKAPKMDIQEQIPFYIRICVL
jgi:hypothetical protein